MLYNIVCVYLYLSEPGQAFKCPTKEYGIVHADKKPAFTNDWPHRLKFKL